MTNRSYDDQAAKAEAGTLGPAGRALRGADAKEAAGQLLTTATGTSTIEEATRVALGRPRIDETNDNVTWRVRATKQLDDALRELSERTGENRSAIIRAAVAEYARAHD